MRRRQTRLPDRWLIADTRLEHELWPMVRALPRGTGILVLFGEMPRTARHRLLGRLRRFARTKRLMLVDEKSAAAVRVHNMRELRRALLARTPLVLLSPMHPTRSHPEWTPHPRMRAAAMARLARRRLVALGGMDAQRFARIEPLGFQAWAGIDAFRT